MRGELRNKIVATLIILGLGTVIAVFDPFADEIATLMTGAVLGMLVVVVWGEELVDLAERLF